MTKNKPKIKRRESVPGSNHRDKMDKKRTDRKRKTVVDIDKERLAAYHKIPKLTNKRAQKAVNKSTQRGYPQVEKPSKP